jgi:predicted metal-binding membrane protein
MAILSLLGWTVAALMFASVIIQLRFGDSVVVALIAALLAVGWHCTSARRLLLHCSHRPFSYPATGIAACIEGLGFGIQRGVICTGICWSAMLFMLLSGRHHLAIMLALMMMSPWNDGLLAGGSGNDRDTASANR